MILYHTVGIGMNAFSHVVLRTEVAGTLEPSSGTLYVVTHRSELDVPLVCGVIYPRLRGGGDDALPWFAVRDDLFLPGYFAHVAPRVMPLSFGVGGVLSHSLRCIPLRPASRMRIVELARAAPSLELDALPVADALRARARSLGRTEPLHARDVLSHRYADILWTVVTRREAPRPEQAWAARLTDARHDLSRLVELLRRGQSVLLFPEGQPSKDGAIAALQRGVGLLVRRGRPQRIVPIGIAYDPTARGRTRAFVRLGEPVAPPTGDIEAALHTLLCRTLPRSEAAAAAFAHRQGYAPEGPPGSAELIERLAREYETALSVD